MPVRSLLKSSLERGGYSIKRNESVPRWENAFALLRRHGLSPMSIFDIGVAQGTPLLYDAFPQADLHLFDPTRESLPFMKSIAEVRPAQVYNLALGDRTGRATIKVRGEIGGSTFFEEVGNAEIVKSYEVEIRRFDEIIESIKRPAFAKIDVQGFELSVLMGMERRLGDLDAILVETSTLSTLKGGAEFRDIVAFFAQQQWSLAEIVSFIRRPLDRALISVDALFVPDGSPIRADRRWAA